MKLSQYLQEKGRGALTKLASEINAPKPDVSSWSRDSRPVPITRCLAIENATNGKVTRKDLRPDDWHEIWPELYKT